MATDLSTRMLDIARERATTLGLTNVEFVEADADRLDFPDGSFEAILCRWGLTSLPDPVNALIAIRRMLAPNGSFATAVWEEGPRGRPLASLATAVARDMFDAPSPQQRAASPSGSVKDALEREMIHAGFKDVQVQEMTLTLDFTSAESCGQYLADVSPHIAALLSDSTSAQRAEYRHRLAQELRPYVITGGRVRIPNVTHCAVGRR